MNRTILTLSCLHPYQAANEISKPLDSLTPSEQNRVLADVCRKIKAAAKVGKTFLARSLAEFMFGDTDALIQIDMSEYMATATCCDAGVAAQRSGEKVEVFLGTKPSIYR